MNESDRSPRKGSSPARWCIVAALMGMASGCMGESEPVRAKDPAKAREALLKKRENPGLPLGPPVQKRANSR